MLGRAFERMLLDDGRYEVQAPGRQELDVTDADAVSAMADWLDGGWIVHCAAMVNVEGCAREPDAARRVIVDGTRHVVALARQTGARILYPQSFLVYDGATNPIPESETPRPLALYGELKYEAERLICADSSDPLVIRMAGFFGGEDADKNFVGRIIPALWKAMQDGRTEFEIGDRVWQPTWTNDLACNSVYLMNLGAQGHYQMACRGSASFAAIGAEIVDALGWGDRLRIVEVSASRFSANELGRRPDVAILSGARLDAEHANLQRSWQATLRAYLQHPFFDQYRLEK